MGDASDHHGSGRKTCNCSYLVRLSRASRLPSRTGCSAPIPGRERFMRRELRWRGVSRRVSKRLPSARRLTCSEKEFLLRCGFRTLLEFPTFRTIRGLTSPRGLAIKFRLPDGTDSDIVAHSFNGFPSPTADDFRDLLIALGSSGPKASKPTPLDNYLATHPIAKAFLTAPKPAPVSYATLPYYGVNTFKFTNGDGQVSLSISANGRRSLSERRRSGQQGR
ncbi:hypothetical protein GGD62_005431 [Bradyrhizobium sp. ERR14]|nr:hypothetical protein [Bradyrhizobium sp. ERR14]